MPRKSEETKELFVRTFEDLLITVPLDKVTVTTLTRSCGLNRQTFYYHFVDMHHFLQYAFRSLLDEVLVKAAVLDTLEDGMNAAFRILDSKKHVVLALTESVGYSWIRRDLLQRISDYCISRYGAYFVDENLTEFNKGFVTRMYALIVFEFVEKWYTEQSYSSMESFTENFRLFFDPYIKPADSYAFDY